MSTIRIDTTSAKGVSDITLKAAPARMLAFLDGAAHPATSGLLAKAGWSENDVSVAWTLLSQLRDIPIAPAPRAATPVADAIAECETWQNTTLLRAKAFLLLGFPEQHEFLFHDFQAQQGIAAALVVATFLKRRQELESRSDRKASHKVDMQALAAMEKTGVTKEVLERLEVTINAAQAMAPVVVPDAARDTRRREALCRIYAWVTAWSDIARTVVTQRNQLIRLGLAKRRPRKSQSTPTPAPVVATPVPPPIVVAASGPADNPEHQEVAPESHAA